MFPPVWLTLIFFHSLFSLFNNAWKFESIECFLKVRFSSVRLWWCLNPKIPFWTPDLDRTKTWTDALTTPSEVICWYRCPKGRSENILSRVKSYFQIYRTHICTEICHPCSKMHFICDACKFKCELAQNISSISLYWVPRKFHSKHSQA